MNQLPEGADPITLPDDQVRSLRAVSGLMIPASSEYQLPGADDDVIFGDILRSIGRDAAAVRDALLALDQYGGALFADLPLQMRAAVADRFRRDRPALAGALVTLVAACYYRDDRVMRSIHMEPRPPFPKGFAVEEGDWSLLEPVLARGRIYRVVP